ncbi:MAG: efflux RND transporter periplasmic adaptor subunit [Pirellulales bacterium]|nr:efflux RND transporter periplasmic adaptor subunit [Pirellulales bacterium]
MSRSRAQIRALSMGVVMLLATTGVGSARTSQDIEIEGITEPYLEIEIAAAEMGLLKGIQVAEGDTVKKGQVVALLDDSVLQAALDIARSAMNSRARRESAEAECELRSRTLEKLRELRARNHATQQELERAELQLRVAEGNLLAVIEEQEVRQLEYEKILAQLRQRQIVSPIDGVVTRVFRDQGEFVPLSDPEIMTVVQLDSLLVVFSVPAPVCDRLELRQSATVQFTLSQTTVSGEIEYISPIVDPQSGTKRVRVRLSNHDKDLPCGASCRLILD